MFNKMIQKLVEAEVHKQVVQNTMVAISALDKDSLYILSVSTPEFAKELQDAITSSTIPIKGIVTVGESVQIVKISR